MPGNTELGAVELSQEQLITDIGFAAPLNPLKPNDLIPPPGVTSKPPACPVCQTFLYPMDMNPAGDMLFECLNGDGHYECIFRVATGRYEPRPKIDRPNWVAPITRTDAKANVGLSPDEEAVLAELLQKKQVGEQAKTKAKARKVSRVVSLRPKKSDRKQPMSPTPAGTTTPKRERKA